jgi:hypothetical protein
VPRQQRGDLRRDRNPDGLGGEYPDLRELADCGVDAGVSRRVQRADQEDVEPDDGDLEGACQSSGC